MIHVDIAEIENGFVVKLFDSVGPSKLDKTIFIKSFEEVLSELEAWFKKEKEVEA